MLYSAPRFVVALLLAASGIGNAYALADGQRLAARVSRATRPVRMAEDPTGSPFIQAINKLQEAIQSSPAAQFKANLAKMQAGDYDKVAVEAKLQSYISEPAVMFSFTT